MNERQRRAITWDKIERMAFHPRDQKDKTRWLSIYGRSLGRFWQVQDADLLFDLNRFEAVFLGLACEYEVQARDKYSVRIINTASARKYSWSLHVDPSYCSKASLVGASEDYPRQDVGQHLRTDVAAVLDGMLFHPRTHCHGEDIELKLNLAGDALPVHEVRIGGGVENAFVFLTHLRFRFCLVASQVRDEERSRLIDLFTMAIGDGRQTIPAAEILNFPR